MNTHTPTYKHITKLIVKDTKKRRQKKRNKYREYLEIERFWKKKTYTKIYPQTEKQTQGYLHTHTPTQKHNKTLTKHKHG